MPVFIEMPVDGVITQGFGGRHGGVDVVDFRGDGAPVYASCDGVLALHPQGSWGDGTFGNAAKIATTDGWFVLAAHLREFAANVYDGQVVKAGHRLGYQGYTGYTIPSGPGGSHVHWAMCRVPWFPQFNGVSAAHFDDPLKYLISEGDRMAIFQKLEELEQTVGQFVGGPGDIAGTRMKGWVVGGNIGLVDCLGPAAADLATFPAVKAQAYALNDVLTLWRPALMTANPGLVLP